MKLLAAMHSFFICCIGYVMGLLATKRSTIVIVGSNYGGRADPNAVAISRYLVEQGERVVVIGDCLPDSAALRVKRGSIQAARYFFLSKACFYTHSLSDIIPFGHVFAHLFHPTRFTKLIFMQHGVIGLKSVSSNGVSMQDYVRSLEKTFDFMLVSSKREKKLVAGFGIPEKKVSITGLPRFDNYKVQRVVAPIVLIFFTWQKSAELQKKMGEVLENTGLRALQNAGYQIVCQHHDMQENLTDSDHTSAIAFQTAIETCALLITDESSLAWDTFYRQQEVVFYKPDSEWLNSDAHLLDRVCRNSKELNLSLDRFLLSQKSDIVDFAEFSDDQNCARVANLAGLHYPSEAAPHE